MKGRRRRALTLLCISLASGALAASEVSDRLRSADARLGPLMPAVVVAQPIDAGSRLDARRASRALQVRMVPRRYAPADVLSSREEALGMRAVVPLAPGAYLTVAQLEGADARAGGLRPGERAIDVAVAGAETLEALAGPAPHVDVLVTGEPRLGAGRTVLALEDVELLALRPAPDSAAATGEASATPHSLATLRVTTRQAIFLTAAQTFAREVRLLARPPGERRHSRPLSSPGLP